MKSYRLLLLDSNGRLLGSRSIECMTDGEAVAVAERESGIFALIEIWRGGDPIGMFTNPRSSKYPALRFVPSRHERRQESDAALSSPSSATSDKCPVAISPTSVASTVNALNSHVSDARLVGSRLVTSDPILCVSLGLKAEHRLAGAIVADYGDVIAGPARMLDDCVSCHAGNVPSERRCPKMD
jgi:hypothetical protein